jgi:putative transposase
VPARCTLVQVGIPRATFHRWCGRYLACGAGALGDGQPAPRRIWNKLPETVAAAVIDLALQELELSPRELATEFVDQRQYFVSNCKLCRAIVQPIICPKLRLTRPPSANHISGRATRNN